MNGLVESMLTGRCQMKRCWTSTVLDRYRGARAKGECEDDCVYL